MVKEKRPKKVKKVQSLESSDRMPNPQDEHLTEYSDAEIPQLGDNSQSDEEGAES